MHITDNGWRYSLQAVICISHKVQMRHTRNFFQLKITRSATQHNICVSDALKYPALSHKNFRLGKYVNVTQSTTE